MQERSWWSPSERGVSKQLGDRTSMAVAFVEILLDVRDENREGDCEEGICVSFDRIGD